MSYFEDSKFVHELNPSDFNQLFSWKIRDKGCSVVLFYANWCHYCKEFRDLYEKSAKKLTFMKFHSFDCAHHVDHCNKIKEELPEFIKGYPTIIFYSKGEPQEQFIQDRTEKNFSAACIKFCK